MSEGNFEDRAKRLSDLKFEKYLYLRWVSGGALEDGTERVSDFGFGRK